MVGCAVQSYSDTRAIRKRGRFVFKPFQSKGRGERENAFYQRSKMLGDLIPRYIETVHFDEQYIQLEDITHDFQRPCIMDVKIGTKSYEPSASASKIQEEVRKFPPQQHLGFRVQGVKVFNTSEGQYETYDKYYCRDQDYDALVELFRIFLGGSEESMIRERNRVNLLPRMIDRLREMRDRIAPIQEYTFVASSLLFVYEAVGPAFGKMDIRLIDFAHVLYEREFQQEYHQGVLRGIDSIIKHLSTIHESDVRIS